MRLALATTIDRDNSVSAATTLGFPLRREGKRRRRVGDGAAGGDGGMRMGPADGVFVVRWLRGAGVPDALSARAPAQVRGLQLVCTLRSG